MTASGFHKLGSDVVGSKSPNCKADGHETQSSQ